MCPNNEPAINDSPSCFTCIYCITNTINMEFQLSEALAIVDQLRLNEFDYIRITMFEERRVIRNNRSEKVILVMKAHILHTAVFRSINTRSGIRVTYGLH